MKKFTSLVGSIFIGLITSYGQDAHLRLCIWDGEWMNEVKNNLNQEDSPFIPAREILLQEADQVLNGGVYSVTFKDITPPGGNKHDYMSMGPYWWPDSDKDDGLPYIGRDGEVNPERNTLDNVQMRNMINSVRVLALAWYFSGETSYAQKAVQLIDTWFLDPVTYMTPHLQYGQAIPGRTKGRFIGIIDARSFDTLVDAITVIESSHALSAKQSEGIKSWFEKYFKWLTESEFGKEEEDYINNHSVAYDVQAGAIAFYLGKESYVTKKVLEVPGRRIDHMIVQDGSQPHELIRTKAYGYSVSNLTNFFDIATIGLKAMSIFFIIKTTRVDPFKKPLIT